VPRGEARRIVPQFRKALVQNVQLFP